MSSEEPNWRGNLGGDRGEERATQPARGPRIAQSKTEETGLAHPRAVAINYDDARRVHGMNLLRHAYLEIAPGLEPYFVTDHESRADPRELAHGSPQHVRNLASSLTTTSSVVATLNSLLAGALASDLVALAGARLAVFAAAGAVVSIASGLLHVRAAARYRRRHALP